MSARRALLLLFFAAQVLAVGYGLTVPEQHFNWVPYDELSVYELAAAGTAGPLSETQIYRRYLRPSRGRENRSIHNLIHLIECREAAAPADSVTVRLTYSRNGQPRQTLLLPRR